MCQGNCCAVRIPIKAVLSLCFFQVPKRENFGFLELSDPICVGDLGNGAKNGIFCSFWS
jgi:hypothetical protein